jgi:hypothetical protein
LATERLEDVAIDRRLLDLECLYLSQEYQLQYR